MSIPPTWGQNPQHDGVPGNAGPGYGQQGPWGPGHSGYGQQGAYGQPTGAPTQGSFGHGQQGAYGQPTGAPTQGSGFGQQVSGQQRSGYGQHNSYGQNVGSTLTGQSGFGQPANPYAQPATGGPGGPGVPSQQAFAGYGEGGGQPPFKKKKPGLALWISLGAAALVVLLVAGVFIAEFVTRGNVDGDLQAKADAIALTQGSDDATLTVEGSFDTTVDGASYLTQQIGGSYEHIAFSGVDLTIDGEPYSATFDAYGVPSDLSSAADRIEVATFLPAQAMLNRIESELESEGESSATTNIEFGDGTYTVEQDFASLDVSFTYVYELRIENGDIVLHMTDSSMTLFGTVIDSDGGDPEVAPLCENMTDVDAEALEATITPDGVSFRWAVTGDGATLDNLSAIGSCF